MTQDVYWHDNYITRQHRQERNNHKSFVLWFTGLSGSGKSSLANAVEKHLFESGHNVIVLDGDNVRHGLCSDLHFSAEDRHENMRRVGEVSKLFVEAGTIVLAAFVSPYREDRERVRSRLPHGDFHEVYCKCDLEVCEERDPKGLYARARKGEIENFTGISAPYEEPIKPDIVINTSTLTIEAEVNVIIERLKAKRLISNQ
ncbi:adenylyl-sulfate kinase [Cocleimonas sp. KMM 6892]|uniref:adenylyl-sulfate kinase n=1 Tax=unclassified Cocleimonas TaxID=2639732 RepID=UPI002DBE9BA5|nr:MULTISPECIES: adenylyl-sulfate kinase [unclassified Cocleimonas]MEB8430930.1 adenylyl-sulfate kinase [Cocleimonas sp. KMM 6892]MEC4714298.1 adenylyl-sulfate kinase [Cocleimonas sp. KMM 6895]MEC4743629.1 adenylyl-sulfate kinase [Cocleimonas sp. KMM 6896]